MVTSVKGDRESKQNFVRGTLDQAFTDRVSALFNDLCNDPESQNTIRIFVDRFKSATDMWNTATTAIQQEYQD